MSGNNARDISVYYILPIGFLVIRKAKTSSILYTTQHVGIYI